MKKNHKAHNNKKYIFILLICLLIFSAGFLWQSLNSKSEKEISSFETCAKAGNPIMETYPEQCSANGKTYTNPNQNLEDIPKITKQGVKGLITLRSGDCMPSIEPPISTRNRTNKCKTETYTTPIEVIIKKPKDLSNKEDKEVVKNIKDVKGTFKAELQPGLYNMYVLYNGREYCNSFGGQKGEDCEFNVEPNKITNYTFQINTATD